MKQSQDLTAMLKAIDRKSYPAYKSLAGSYQFDNYILYIDHVQGDPFASPSSLRAEIPHRIAGFPEEYYKNDFCRTALEDHLTRRLFSRFQDYNFKAKGSGKSGLLSISRCGQEILSRSACEIGEKGITVRFHVGFPAFGRTIQAGELEKILFDFLPKSIQDSFLYKRLDKREVERVIFLAEDQEYIRSALREKGLAAFVADGSILPRKSGVSDLPMTGSVPFSSPSSLKIQLDLPHKGLISGMALKKGITLIVGGGYHGKSTLLEALQTGVYNHIAGDGREYVITDSTALKLRAEDGRCIKNVDISMFINDLPNKKDTKKFSTPDASGSTSQAAGILEGIESGTKLFLIDEDTSATNFMVRDDLMQQVISRDKEPITPFLERALDLYEKMDISTILVAGSSGAFFYIAHTIIQMDCYRPVDITQQVKTMCLDRPAPRIKADNFLPPNFQRILGGRPSAVSPKEISKGRENGGRRDRSGQPAKIKTFGIDSFSLNKETVDLRYVEQLADSEQTAALAYILRYALEHVLDGRKTLRQSVDILEKTLHEKGWAPFCTSYIPCGLAVPRRQEIFACLNRYRG